MLRGRLTATISGRTRTLRSGETATMDVDRTPPAVGILRPGEQAAYLLNQRVAAAYACHDLAAAIASCEGTVPSGKPIATGVVGVATFTVTGTDTAGNVTTRSVPYSIGYAITPLADEPERIGDRRRRAFVALRISDAAGVNRSSRDITVTPVALVASDGSRMRATGAFHFEPARTAYVYTVDDASLTAGRYSLTFAVDGDPILHTVEVRVP